VSDARLLGYWSDDVLYQGDMEVAEIAFAPHESGWIYWARDGGVFTVDRFVWADHRSAATRVADAP
jgi:hypothetical protein